MTEIATRSVTPGDIVVSFNDIVDVLKTKLTKTELDDLIRGIVSKRKKEVLPGDLITADLINGILADIADLQIRLAELETASVPEQNPPMLTSRWPSGDVEIGSLLTLYGSNFEPFPGNNTVTLGNVDITQFLDGGPTRLIFQVPDLFSGLPKDVKTFVTSHNCKSNELSVRLLPHAEPQGGQVVIFEQTKPLGEITIGGSYTLQWLVDSQTTLPATYRFNLLFTEISGASESAWKANSQTDPSGEKQIVRGKPLPVTATVKVPDGAVSATVALQVESTDGQFKKTSQPLSFNVGGTPEVSDDRALFTIPEIGPFDSQGHHNPLRNARITVGTEQFDGLQLKFGATGTIPFNLHVTNKQGAAGDYYYSAEVEDDAGLWQILKIVPVSNRDLPAPTDTQVFVDLKNTDTGKSSVVKFLTVRATHHPKDSANKDFVSFIRVPIQGYSS